MPRRKQQSPKRLKACLEAGQEDELEDDKLDDEETYNMDGEDADDEGDGEEYEERRLTKRRRNYERGNGGRPETYRDDRDTLSDYSEEDEEVRPLNLSGLMGLKATVEPHHIVHYLPNTPPNGTPEKDSDEANAQAAAIAASIAIETGDRANLSAAHATWVESVQQMITENITTDNVFHCLECNSRFLSNEELLIHLHETGHITGRPLDPSVNDVSTCKGYDLCIGPNGQLFSKCFLRRQQKRSTETGTNVCNLRCKQCSKTFPTLLSLTLHMKEAKHVNTNKGNRKKKQKTHHLDYEEEIQVDKVMKCMVCGKSYDNLQDLTMHMMESQHFSRVPGYKTETLLQQQQEQHQHEEEGEEVAVPLNSVEQLDEREESEKRVVVADPPVIAAARAMRIAASESRAYSSRVNMPPVSTHRSMLDGLLTPMPNYGGMSVRSRLHNKTNNSRVLRCLACDHSFDSIHSLTKHMTQTGHYQKAAEDGTLVPSSLPIGPNGNVVKWELVSAVPTSNGMYTHVKSKVISHPVRSRDGTPDHSEVKSESPPPKLHRNVPGIMDVFSHSPSMKPTSAASIQEPKPHFPSTISAEDKYINPDHYELRMSNHRTQLNPLGNLEALVHGAAIGRFGRTDTNIPASTSTPDRGHTVHWTGSANSRMYDCTVPLKSTHTSSQYSRVNDRISNSFASMSNDDKPLDFSMPKLSKDKVNRNKEEPHKTVPPPLVKLEPTDQTEAQDKPLALTVKKNMHSERKVKDELKYEGLAGKIKPEPDKRSFGAKRVRRSQRVQKIKEEYTTSPLGASQDKPRDRNKNLTKKDSPEMVKKTVKKDSPEAMKRSKQVNSSDVSDIPKPLSGCRTVYQQVNQNGYLATAKGGVLPMGTGAYEGQNDDPLKAMNQLVQNAVVGNRQSPGSKKINKNESVNSGIHNTETECGLKIALFGPIMGNDDITSNPLEEIDKLVNAAI